MGYFTQKRFGFNCHLSESGPFRNFMLPEFSQVQIHFKLKIARFVLILEYVKSDLILVLIRNILRAGPQKVKTGLNDYYINEILMITLAS